MKLFFSLRSPTLSKRRRRLRRRLSLMAGMSYLAVWLRPSARCELTCPHIYLNSPVSLTSRLRLPRYTSSMMSAPTKNSSFSSFRMATSHPRHSLTLLLSTELSLIRQYPISSFQYVGVSTIVFSLGLNITYRLSAESTTSKRPIFAAKFWKCGRAALYPCRQRKRCPFFLTC